MFSRNHCSYVKKNENDIRFSLTKDNFFNDFILKYLKMIFEKGRIFCLCLSSVDIDLKYEDMFMIMILLKVYINKYMTF